MTTTLFEDAAVVTPDANRRADWVLVDDGVVTATGDSSDAPSADRRVTLDGATLAPAFCDAHVHLPATGLYAGGLDFRGERSAAAIVDAFAERAAKGDGLLFGGNFEDPLDRPLTAPDLDAAVGARPALLARADMHSCVVSTALLRALPLEEPEGVDVGHDGRPTGYLRERAASQAWSWFERTLPEDEQRRAIAQAAKLAYGRGIASVHEMYVVEWRGWSSLELVRAALEPLALDVVVYVGTSDVERVLDLGLERIGGDYFLDGSFGSHTAWLSEPYTERPPGKTSPTGISYRDTVELVEFFGRAQDAGLQVGVHAIGDAAIEQAMTTWEEVARGVGDERVRALGHRIEHFECASDEHMRRAARLGLRASVQPAFDRLWGGPEGMYARRIGARRAAGMNRFASMLAAGLTLGAGSDSTVTPLDPFLGMASLRAHHEQDQSLAAADALHAHTVGAHALAGRDAHRGSIASGKSADLVALDRDPLEVAPDELVGTEVMGTWIGGRRVWPEEEAESA